MRLPPIVPRQMLVDGTDLYMYPDVGGPQAIVFLVGLCLPIMQTRRNVDVRNCGSLPCYAVFMDTAKSTFVPESQK